MTAKTVQDGDRAASRGTRDSKIDILFALRLFLEAAAPENSVHELFARAIHEIERLRAENETLQSDIYNIIESETE